MEKQSKGQEEITKDEGDNIDGDNHQSKKKKKNNNKNSSTD